MLMIAQAGVCNPGSFAIPKAPELECSRALGFQLVLITLPVCQHGHTQDLNLYCTQGEPSLGQDRH